METGIHESNNEEHKPSDPVAGNDEATEGKPQPKTIGDSDFYIDEGNQEEEPKTNMTHEQSYAAFRKEQEKRKKKAAELKKREEENQLLKNEMEQLKKQVNNLSRGEMPDPYDFDDKHAYYKALKEWEGSGSSQKQGDNPAQTQQKTQQRDDNADFYLYQKEQDLINSIPDYEKSKNSVINSMSEKYGVNDVESVINSLSSIAMQSNVDIAKAFLAMDKIPSLIEELDRNATNPFAVSKILEKAASKVKTRNHKSIETKPEPQINNTGPVDNVNAEVDKLRKEWVKNSTTANYKKYMAAKKRLTENG